jgi:AraC-like DNA-binding protein
MANSRPILSFSEPHTVRRMPFAFRELASHGYLATASEATPKITYRVSWIEDWWFTTLRCEGHIHIKTEAGIKPPKGYALITLPLAGKRPPKMSSRTLGQTGCITVTPWNDVYEFENSGLAHYLVAHVPSGFLLDTAGLESFEDFSTTVSAFQGTGQVLSATLRALANASEHANRNTEKSLSSLLPDCSRIIKSVLSHPSSNSGYSERCTRLDRIREYMEERSHDPFLNSDEVAEACGLSRRQLYREFSLHGESFAEVLKQLRLQKAVSELASDHRASISEIAFRCGFLKLTTFNKAFREYHGCCPREFNRGITTR